MQLSGRAFYAAGRGDALKLLDAGILIETSRKCPKSLCSSSNPKVIRASRVDMDNMLKPNSNALGRDHQNHEKARLPKSLRNMGPVYDEQASWRMRWTLSPSVKKWQSASGRWRCAMAMTA